MSREHKSQLAKSLAGFIMKELVLFTCKPQRFAVEIFDVDTNERGIFIRAVFDGPWTEKLSLVNDRSCQYFMYDMAWRSIATPKQYESILREWRKSQRGAIVSCTLRQRKNAETYYQTRTNDKKLRA
jgi:hypothetical protein